MVLFRASLLPFLNLQCCTWGRLSQALGRQIKEIMKTEEIFDSVVRNAIDFITTAIIELKEKPKYSVINFYTALELFFKARVLKEHWTLIVKKRGQVFA